MASATAKHRARQRCKGATQEAELTHARTHAYTHRPPIHASMHPRTNACTQKGRRVREKLKVEKLLGNREEYKERQRQKSGGERHRNRKTEKQIE
eukprot:5591471-Pleurochrysis_carterae.AAC.1